MVRQILYKETEDGPIDKAVYHGLYPVSFHDEDLGAVIKTMAVIEDNNGVLKEVPFESIKFEPSTINMTRKNNLKIFKPGD